MGQRVHDFSDAEVADILAGKQTWVEKLDASARDEVMDQTLSKPASVEQAWSNVLSTHQRNFPKTTIA
jgi:hypothetical protein